MHSTLMTGIRAHRRGHALGTLVLAAALGQGACASKPPLPPPPPPPVELKVSVHVAADANPEPNGRPSPVVVRVYQLRSDDAFKGQDLEALYFKDKEVLAADIVTREEWTLKPGESHDAHWLVPNDVHVVSLVAALREYRGVTWRVNLPIPPQPKPKAPPAAPLLVEIGRDGVHLGTAPTAGR